MALRLRARLSLALLALALVPLAVTTLVLVRVNLQRLRLSAKEYRLAVADDVGRLVRSTLRQADAELGALGAAFTQRIPPEDRVRAVQSLLRGARLVHVVALYDRQGALVETFTAPQRPTPVRRPERLGDELRGAARTEGRVFLGTAAAKDGTLHLPMILPVYAGPERRLYGYVWTALALAPLDEEVARVSQRRFDGDRQRVYLVDQTLRVVAHADGARRGQPVARRGLFADLEHPRQILTRDVALSADYEADGKRLLGVLQPIPELGWGIVVEQPRDRAYAAVRATWVTALAVGAAFLLVALVLGIVMARRLAAPVLAVAEAAGKVAGGDFTQRVPATRKDEVGDLARSFNTMASDLVAYEARVVEETRIRTDLSRYLSAELVDGIVKQEIDLKLGGERREVAVLFADVVAFTPLVEKHDPEQVVAVLNELFTFLTEIVFKHGGIVDKFIGDSVMAVFGVPSPQPDAALRAARAAEEMLRWLETGNVRWRKQLGQDLQLALGLNVGQAVAGNVGSEKRMEYTVIGDVVNVAARLEALARPGQILMTAEVAALISGEFDTEPMGEQTLPGRAKPIAIEALLP